MKEIQELKLDFSSGQKITREKMWTLLESCHNSNSFIKLTESVNIRQMGETILFDGFNMNRFVVFNTMFASESFPNGLVSEIRYNNYSNVIINNDIFFSNSSIFRPSFLKFVVHSPATGKRILVENAGTEIVNGTYRMSEITSLEVATYRKINQTNVLSTDLPVGSPSIILAGEDLIFPDYHWVIGGAASTAYYVGPSADAVEDSPDLALNWEIFNNSISSFDGVLPLPTVTGIQEEFNATISVVGAYI
jgi:hypothetical protein